MRFDSNLQQWVDDNGNPLTVQPPKPINNIPPIDSSLEGYNYQPNNYSNINQNIGNEIISRQNFNFEVPKFQNFNPVQRDQEGNFFQPKQFDFSVPTLSTTDPIKEKMKGLSPLEQYKFKSSIDFTSNINGIMKDVNSTFDDFQRSKNANEAKQSYELNQQNKKEQFWDNMNNLSQNIGKTYSLDSALYGLGYALGPKDYTGMTKEQIDRDKSNNLMLGVGSAGKAIVGGARTLMSGMGNAHMDNWMQNEFRRRRRENLVNNQTGVEDAYVYNQVGGAPVYKEGGEINYDSYSFEDAYKKASEENKSNYFTYKGKNYLLTNSIIRNSPKIEKFQEGGQQGSEDIVSKLQQAVENGDITEEEVNQYLQQIQNQQTQEQPQQGDLMSQLQQAVQSGQISAEEAQAYLQKAQQEQPQQTTQQEQPQINPEEAQKQLQQAVENGDITPEEAQSYLQKLYGNVETSSEPKEPYTGEVREKISPEKYLTGEVTTGDETKPYNSEVEKGEYINRDGVTQEVVGKKHSQGGEKMNLEKGTIVITDDTRIGVINAKALSQQTGLKLKAGDTYAQVIDIFSKKIGIEKLNKEQEELFKKLQKVEGVGNKKTQELNNEFLNSKINNIEEKKKELLQQREQLVQVLFKLQENGKKQYDQEYVSEANEENSEVPKYQKGDEVGDNPYVLPKYGNELITDIIEHYKNKPDYTNKDLASELESLKNWAKESGVDLPENLKNANISTTKDLQSLMDNFAGVLQKNVKDPLAIHYGQQVAPTQNGLQWLVDQGKISKNIPGVIKNGKVLVGSYYSLNEEQKKKVAEAVDGLKDNELNNYSLSNFRDNKWFFRRPSVETVYFKDKDSFDKFKTDNQNILDNTYFSGKQGKYLNPILLQEKEFNNKQEYDNYINKYGKNLDKVHNQFMSEGDPTTYYLPKYKENNNAEEVDKNNWFKQPKKRNNVFLLPDQSTLPPEALRAVPKFDIRYNYLDNLKISPEQNLVENYRDFATSKAAMEGLPDVMNHANLAMLTGNIAQANNQAINQINASNAQIAQQVNQANNQILNHQQEMNLNLADQYDQRMNRALDVTRKDIEGYYDFNRRVNVGEFNTRHQLSVLNNLFDKYGIGMEGVPEFSPLTDSPYALDPMQAIKLQEYKKAYEEAAKKQAMKQAENKTKTKSVSSNWSNEK